MPLDIHELFVPVIDESPHIFYNIGTKGFYFRDEAGMVYDNGPFPTIKEAIQAHNDYCAEHLGPIV